MNPRFIHIVALAAALAPGAAPARSQTSQPAETAPARPAGGAVGAVALHPEPFEFPGLGLTISLPEGGLVETTTAGPNESFSVRPEDRSWLLSFEERRSRDLNLMPNAIAEELIAGFEASRQRTRSGGAERRGAAESEVKVLDRQPSLVLGGVPASRFYITIPDDQTRVIHAYTVFRAEPGRFVLARMQCLEAELPRARLIYETVVASAAFRDPVAAATERAAAIMSGEALLGALTSEQFDLALMPEAEWRRLHRPASAETGADEREVAFQKVEIRRGARGDLTPERPRERWNATEQQEGYVVRVVARYLDGGRVIDSESVFYATLALSDRDEEAWTVRIRIKEGSKEAVWTETGARFDKRLSVRVQAEGQPPTETTWTIPERGYITQVESFMLPRLLAQSKTPLVFSFYCYNSTSGKMELRRDVLAPADGGGWILRTRLTEGTAERESSLTDDGDLIRTRTADGVVMEPIEIDRLHSLWKSKGLPTAE